MKLLILIILTLFLITSCAPVQETTPEVTEDSMEEIPEEETTTEEVAEPEVPEKAEEVTQELIEDPEIAELVEKSSKVKNYQYLYQRTTDIASTGYKVFYLEGRILKEYTSPKRVSEDLSYNKIYLDMNEETAFAVCDTNSIACKGNRLKIYTINYESEELPFLSHELPMRITADAVNKGDELVENRKTLLVEYDNISINLDKFSGVASKYSVKGSGESHSFTQLGINSVTEEDVTAPSGYELVN